MRTCYLCRPEIFNDNPLAELERGTCDYCGTPGILMEEPVLTHASPHPYED